MSPELNITVISAVLLGKLIAICQNYKSPIKTFETWSRLLCKTDKTENWLDKYI